MRKRFEKSLAINILIFVRPYGYISNESVFFKTIKQLNENCLIIDDRCLCLPNFEQIEGQADLLLYSTGKKKPVDLGTGAIALVKQSYFPLNYLSEFEYKHKYENIINKLVNKKSRLSSNANKYIKLAPWLDTNRVKFESLLIKANENIVKIKEHKQKLNIIY